MALLKSFTASHAQELVRIAKKYNSQLNLAEVVEEYSQKTNKKDAEGSMNDYLEQLEGALERGLNPKIKKGVQNAPEVDTENQFVAYDPGLEKTEQPLKGGAKEIRNVPQNTLPYKPIGRYTIVDVKNNYKVGSQLVLNFYGTYHGKKANFKDIVVEVVSAPVTKQGHKYVQVRFPHNQRVFIKSLNKSVYFSREIRSFYVQIN